MLSRGASIVQTMPSNGALVADLDVADDELVNETPVIPERSRFLDDARSPASRIVERGLRELAP